MIKVLQKDFAIPLPTKELKIMGIRVENSPQPHIIMEKEQLTIKDNWNVQLVYTPLADKDYIVNPTLLEYQVEWAETLEYAEELRGSTINYKKKPCSIASSIRENPDYKATLYLTMEIVIEIKKATSPSPLAAITTSIQPEKESLPVYATYEQLKFLEERILQLEKLVSDLSSFKNSLETSGKEQQPPPNSPVKSCNMKGKIIDAFRLAPVANAIIEFTLPEQEEPLRKIATDERGSYSLKIEPGIYDIKIKHPRYLFLFLRGFTINEAEEKIQDFMLRRA